MSNRQNVSKRREPSHGDHATVDDCGGHMRTWKKFGFAGAGGIGTVILLSTSTVCGCIAAEHSLAWELGIKQPMLGSAKSMPLPELERIATSKYRGETLASLSTRFTGRNVECNIPERGRWTCVFWFEAGLLRKEGRQFGFVADKAGNVERVEVKDVSRWTLS